MPGETYRSYLLRLWKPVDGKGVRIAVEDVQTGQSHAFPDLERFQLWLVRETDAKRESAARVISPRDGD